MTAALHDATAEQARSLTDRIKVAVEGTWHLITEAYTSRAWAALGYTSWDDYCTREFGTSRLRLPREHRSEVVQSLSDSGLSLRAIEAATGISKPTIIKDLRGTKVVNSLPPASHLEGLNVDLDETDDDPALTQAECEALDGTELEEMLTDAELAREEESIQAAVAPARITGTDGKSYPKPEPQSEPKAPPRKALTETFWRATYDMGKGVERLVNLTADDRFKKNADQIEQANLQDLIRARDALQRVIDQLTTHEGV